MNKFLSFCLLLWHNAICYAEVTSKLDSVVIQLRSQSDAQRTALLQEVLQLTSHFLDDYFGAYYDRKGPKDYFNELRLTADSFGVQGTSGSFVTTIAFEGGLALQREPVPSPDFTLGMLTNAFKGYNLDIYLESLLRSKTPFLRDLTHVFVDIAGEHSTQASIGEERHNAISNSKNESEAWELGKYAEIAIFLTAGVVGAVAVVGLFCFCRCLCGKTQVQDEGDALAKNKTKDVERAESFADTRITSRSSTRGASRSRREERNNSSQRSIVSENSSVFTYNASVISKDVGTISLGSVSNLNFQSPNFDLEAWQNPSVISSRAPQPFGHDISAIEQRDQVSILESDDSILRTRGSQPYHGKSRSNKASSSSALDRSFASRSCHADRAPPRPYYTTTILETSGRDSASDASISVSSDVISDLKNLSLQIDEYRRSKAKTTYRG